MIAWSLIVAAALGAHAGALPTGGELFGRMGLQAPAGAALPDAPASAAGRFAGPAGPPVDDGALIKAELWQRSAAPSAAAVQAIISRCAWTTPSAVREVSLADAEALLDKTVDRLSPLDLFTDAGLRSDQVYYISAATLAALDAKYQIASIVALSGADKHGQPFAMQAIVMGAGHTDVFYDRDFEYANPFLPGYSYQMKAHINEAILGEGALGIDGITVNAGLFKPKVRKVTKISPTEVRVETTLKTVNKPLRVITRK